MFEMICVHVIFNIFFIRVQIFIFLVYCICLCVALQYYTD
jgi:hypothetical protein